jgi:hypothetical protein
LIIPEAGFISRLFFLPLGMGIPGFGIGIPSKDLKIFDTDYGGKEPMKRHETS